MPATPKPKLNLSKLVLKIETFTLKLDNPPKTGKIYVTLQAGTDNPPHSKGDFIKSSRQKADSEMQWKMNTDIVVDARGFIVVDINEYHRRKPFKSRPLIPGPLLLKNEDIFNRFIKSDITGNIQEFTLVGNNLTIILGISGHSLEDILKTFSPLNSLIPKLGKYQAGLDLILQIAGVLGRLNVTAGVVLGAVTQIFEFLKTQEKCHKDILELFAHMGDMLSIIADAGPLKEHSKKVEGVIESTLNCIEGAVKQVLIKCQGNLLKQLVLSSELAENISDFCNAFDNLKAKYLLVLTQVTALLSLSAEHTRVLMEKLKPQFHEGHKVCMESTRVELLSDLAKSIKENSIVWLHGLAGTGKSSIVGSLEQMFHQKSSHPELTGIDLAISFHCTRGTRSEDLHMLVPTLAYNIAERFSAFGRYLASDPMLNTSGGLHYQFNNLLHQPLNMVTKERNEYPTRQILVIIDALDEWAQEKESRKLFLLEIQELCKNHSWLHFMITSRPNAEISEVFTPGEQLRIIDIQQDPNTQDDIAKFLRKCIKKNEKVEQAISEDDVRWLLSYVESLFILADTAFKFLAQALYPQKHLNILKKQVKGSKSGTNSYGVLYDLYNTVLTEAIQDPPNDTIDYMNVIGTLFILQQPVTANALQKFTSNPVQEIVRSLGAVIYKSGDGKLKYHLSFKEFIQDEGVKRGFNINLKEQHMFLTTACLKVLMSQLRFNICYLEDSCIPNEFISNPRLGERVEKYISEELQYSCESWVHHLCMTDNVDHTVLNQVVQLMTGEKIMYWMECLSLMGRTSQIRDSMDNLSDQTKWKHSDLKIPEAAIDIAKFVRTFYFPIAYSTPHLYQSALAMIPENTLLYHHLHGFLKNVIRIKQEGKHRYWASEINQIPLDSAVDSASYSPDGKHIVTGSRDQTVRIWNAETGQPVREPLMGHTDWVQSVAYSPDGKQIVSGSRDQTVRIWDTETGQPVGNLLKKHTDWVQAAVYSPDGKHIVSGSRDSTVLIWSAITGQPIGGPLKGHANSVTSVAYSPDGKHIVSGSRDETVRIWDAKTGQLVGKPLKGHTHSVESVAYSPNGQHIVSGSRDQKIRIWDAVTGQPVGEPLHGHTHSVLSLAYSPNGKYIVSGSGDQTVRTWDAKTGLLAGEPLKGHTRSVWSAVYSPDGKHIMSGSRDRTVRIWNAETVQPQIISNTLSSHTDWIHSVAYAPDGRHIVSGSLDFSIRFWDGETGNPVGQSLMGHTNWIESVAYSPDQNYIASGSRDRTVRIWDTHTGKSVGMPLIGHTDWVQSVAYSPDGKHIVSGSSDRTVRIWNADTGQLTQEPFKGHTGWVESVAFFADGKCIVSGSRDQTLRIWNTETGKPMRDPLKGHTDWIQSVACSPDGKYIVSGSRDKTVRIWDAKTGRPIRHPLRGHTDCVQSVACFLDGVHIVSSSRDHTLRIWNVVTGCPVGNPLKGHTDWVQSVSCSPDGTHFVSGSGDQTVRVWSTEIAIAQSLGDSLKGQTHSVLSSPLPSDEKNIVSGSYHTVRIWKAVAGQAVAEPIYGHSCSILPSSVYLDMRGWVVSSEGHLLFWLPSQYRFGATNHQQIFTMPADATNSALQIDYSNFTYGKNWEGCWKKVYVRR